MAGIKIAKTGSGKKDAGRVRMLHGEKVIPVKWVGSAIGKGTYMTGKINNELVLADDGYPIPLKLIGELV